MGRTEETSAMTSWSDVKSWGMRLRRLERRRTLKRPTIVAATIACNDFISVSITFEGGKGDFHGLTYHFRTSFRSIG